MISKKTFAKIALALLIGSSVILPFAAMAAENAGGSTAVYNPPSLWPTGYWGQGGLVSCTGNYLPTAQQKGQYIGTTPPPACTDLCDLIDTIINILYFIMTIGIFIITPLSFVAGAIMITIAGANPEMLGKGKKLLTSTVIGLIIILCSYLLVATVVKVLGISGIGGFGTNICSITTPTQTLINTSPGYTNAPD